MSNDTTTKCDCCREPLDPEHDATRWSGFARDVAQFGIAGPLCEECLQETLQAMADEEREMFGHGELEDQLEDAFVDTDPWRHGPEGDCFG